MRDLSFLFVQDKKQQQLLLVMIDFTLFFKKTQNILSQKTSGTVVL